MKRILILSLLLAQFLFLQAQERLGCVNDPDGYTNVRKEKSSKSEILFKITKSEYFYFESNQAEGWFNVENMDGKSGFMHKSRIEPVIEINVQNKTYKSAGIKLKVRTKHLEKLRVIITQIQEKHSSGQAEEDCNAFIDLDFLGRKWKSVAYENIKPLGGNAGVAFLEDVIPEQILLVKHGGSEGKTIIINAEGKLTELVGSRVSGVIEDR